MKKKICAVLLIVCVSSLLCSCYMEDVDDRPVQVTEGSFDCLEWVDPDTGIHYLYDKSGGCNPRTLTPRLNSDGTVMGTEQTRKTKTKTKKVQKKKDKGNKKNEKQK